MRRKQKNFLIEQLDLALYMLSHSLYSPPSLFLRDNSARRVKQLYPRQNGLYPCGNRPFSDENGAFSSRNRVFTLQNTPFLEIVINTVENEYPFMNFNIEEVKELYHIYQGKNGDKYGYF